MINYSCPNCQTLLASPSALAGQYDECPVCRSKNVVPAPKPKHLWWACGGGAGGLVLAACAAVLVWQTSHHVPPPSDQASQSNAEYSSPAPVPSAQVTRLPSEAARDVPTHPKTVGIPVLMPVAATKPAETQSVRTNELVANLATQPASAQNTPERQTHNDKTNPAPAWSIHRPDDRFDSDGFAAGIAVAGDVMSGRTPLSPQQARVARQAVAVPAGLGIATQVRTSAEVDDLLSRVLAHPVGKTRVQATAETSVETNIQKFGATVAQVRPLVGRHFAGIRSAVRSIPKPILQDAMLYTMLIVSDVKADKEDKDRISIQGHVAVDEFGERLGKGFVPLLVTLSKCPHASVADMAKKTLEELQNDTSVTEEVKTQLEELYKPEKVPPGHATTMQGVSTYDGRWEGKSANGILLSLTIASSCVRSYKVDTGGFVAGRLINITVECTDPEHAPAINAEGKLDFENVANALNVKIQFTSPNKAKGTIMVERESSQWIAEKKPK